MEYDPIPKGSIECVEQSARCPCPLISIITLLHLNFGVKTFPKPKDRIRHHTSSYSFCPSVPTFQLKADMKNLEVGMRGLVGPLRGCYSGPRLTLRVVTGRSGSSGWREVPGPAIPMKILNQADITQTRGQFHLLCQRMTATSALDLDLVIIEELTCVSSVSNCNS